MQNNPGESSWGWAGLVSTIQPSGLGEMLSTIATGIQRHNLCNRVGWDTISEKGVDWKQSFGCMSPPAPCLVCLGRA